jgi:hypothetical protein
MTNNIEDFVSERGIKSLLHFTQKDNLDSILSRGLITRNILSQQGNSSVFNDQIRLDRTDAICVTIGFPNYKMFYGLRKSKPNSEWLILVISPRALWELECAFCQANAASSAVRDIPLVQRKSVDALKLMFADFGEKKRITLGLPNSLPTNPQAEVLLLNGISRKYILGALVPTREMEALLEKLHPDVLFKWSPKHFGPRSDFATWKKIDV